MRGAQQRAKLGHKQIGLVQANANRAVAQKRILLFFQVQRGNFLIAANIQSADDDRLARHRLASPFVGFKLLLFARQVVAVHKQEL